MIDIATQKPLTVDTDGGAGPYIMVSVRQLEALQQLLNSANVPHYVEEHVISLDGGPEIGVVDLGRKADPQAVQTLLDSAA
jgi:hypothetical protein